MYRRIKDFLVYTFTEEHDSYNYVYQMTQEQINEMCL